MFESPTLSVSELAERWKKTPRQILDYAQALGVPLYFMFDGLAFDLSDRWHRENGDVDQRGELDLLRKGIARNESWIRRTVRGENGEGEQQLTTEEIQALRIEIEADKKNCEQIRELLEQRETSRKKMHHRGLMRAAPKTLFDIAQYGEARYTPKAFYPGTPVRVVNVPEQAMPIVDGRLMSLEPFEALPPLTINSLCAVTAEVKAIEAYLKAKQTAQEPQAATPAPVVTDSASNAPAWTVIKPLRYNGYTAPLHRLIAAAHRDGKPCPTARDVVEAWRNNAPAEIAKVLPDGFDYYDTKGDTKTADLEAIRKAIGRMTSAR